MSPRRRWFAAGLAAVLVLLVVAGSIVLRRQGATVDAVPPDRPGPVLLVPGYGGSTGSLRVLADALRDSGRRVSVVNLPGDGTGDLRAQAGALRAAADAAVAGGAPSVDVIGYSAGGVVARIWAADLGGAAVARRIVTLGSPHHGTSVAELAVGLAPSACPLACRQLVPGSDLLDGLPEAPRGPVWTSLWTAQDETVTPPQSAVLDGALDVRLQSVCPQARISHGQLPRDRLVVGLVRQALGVPGLAAAPGPAQCDAVRALGAASGTGPPGGVSS
jgi:triacylglycerol lipase